MIPSKNYEVNLMSNEEKEIIEIKEMCGKILANWIISNGKKDFTKHDEDIVGQFIPAILLTKFTAFGVDIVLPDELLILLMLCSDGNPGLVQAILMDLLESIKDKNGPIPKGYVISAYDFALAFPFEFPIIKDETILNKYVEKYDTKIKRRGYNLCDTPEFWLKYMEE